MKNLIKLFVIAVMTISLFACEKEENPSYPDGTYYYMPVPSSNLKSTYAVNEVEPIFFNPIPEKFYDNLVVNYHLDGDATDAGINGLDGLIVGADGNESLFNEVSDSTCIVIEDDDALDITETITIALWYNYNSNVKADYMQNMVGKVFDDTISSGANQSIWTIGFDNRPTLGNDICYIYTRIFDSNGQNVDATITYNDAKDKGIDLLSGWHFIVATFDATDENEIMKMYLDGVLIYYSNLINDAPVVDIATSTKPMYIGRGGNRAYTDDDKVSYFYGALDEVLVLNRCLSDEEVKELYNLRIVQ